MKQDANEIPKSLSGTLKFSNPVSTEIEVSVNTLAALLKENQELKALKAELVREIEQLILHAEEDSLTYSVLEHARKLVYLKIKS